MCTDDKIARFIFQGPTLLWWNCSFCGWGRQNDHKNDILILNLQFELILGLSGKSKEILWQTNIIGLQSYLLSAIYTPPIKTERSKTMLNICY